MTKPATLKNARISRAITCSNNCRRQDGGSPVRIVIQSISLLGWILRTLHILLNLRSSRAWKKTAKGTPHSEAPFADGGASALMVFSARALVGS